MSAWRLGVSVLLVLTACASKPAPERRAELVEWFLRSVEGNTVNIVYTITGVASDCERKGKVVVEESENTVRIGAYKSVIRDRNRACTEELGYVDEAATLSRPLGSRSLIGCQVGGFERPNPAVCESLERSRMAGIFNFPTPSSSG